MKKPPMHDRRSLLEGLKQTPPPIDPQLEKDFVFQAKSPSTNEGTASSSATTATQNTQTVAKAPSAPAFVPTLQPH